MDNKSSKKKDLGTNTKKKVVKKSKINNPLNILEEEVKFEDNNDKLKEESKIKKKSVKNNSKNNNSKKVSSSNKRNSNKLSNDNLKNKNDSSKAKSLKKVLQNESLTNVNNDDKEESISSDLLEDKQYKKVINPIDEKVYKVKKRKLKKWVKYSLIILLLLIILIGIFLGISVYFQYKEAKNQQKIEKEQEKMSLEISKHYGNYVLVNSDSLLYKKDEDGNLYEYGMVYANTEVSLEEMEITHLTEYFYSSDLDCYIKYGNLEPISNLSEYSNRYKNYIVFNQNIITKDEFSLYDNGNKIYSFKKSMSFPIIIKNDNGKYYVEFNNRLLYLLKDDIKEFVNTNNTSSKNASKITTLCYHRVYNPDEKCNDLYICKSRSNFEREMKYLKDNNYLTLTMNEMYLYLTKKLQVPKKSVVLTFDDGYLFKNAIEVLEQYNLHGTGFIKTAYFDDLSIFESPNFELQSHTHDMHKAGTCPKETSVQQGGGILCLSENTVLNDLKLSRDKLNGAIALAYPFYDYNTRAVKLVERAGFKLAFIGANSVGGRSYPGINTYKVPRMTIWNTTSFDKFKSYVIN